MDTPKQQQRRKRKRISRPTFSSLLWSLILCFSCFILLFLLLLLDAFSTIGSSAFCPVLIVSRLPLLSSSSSAATNSILLHSAHDSDDDGFLPLKVEDRILFPDHVLLLLSNSNKRLTDPSLQLLHQGRNLCCVYFHRQSSNISNSISLPFLSLDEFDDSRSIARCPTPPANHSASVFLERHRIREQQNRGEESQPIHLWESLVYGAALDGETAVVFVKGLNLRPDRVSDPTQFVCYFDWENRQRHLTTEALSAAQEVVRCLLPVSIRNNRARAHGIRVTIGFQSTSQYFKINKKTITQDMVTQFDQRLTLRGLNRFRSPPLYTPLPSIAKIFNSQEKEESKGEQKKYELCVCTMIWNQASSLGEWIIYHAWLGVERWFIYDNNSDDNIKQVIDELNQENYNVSRHVWPWLKTQEAGFSHCILKAKANCNWVGFMDVDEFFYFPVPSSHSRTKYPGRDSLKSLVANFSLSATIGEIRTACHSFGPSGLSTVPSQGVTVGYTCRLQSPERHKSIVRPTALDDTLLNVVHHFQLKTGFRYLNLQQSTIVINHYKYQVWEAFRAKFSRRVATYVTDWHENQNEGSKDRAPGLGTEAIEPPNWKLQFCEVWDTGLRDFVMANLADLATGMLPWESSLQ